MLLSRVLALGALGAGCLLAQADYKIYVLHNSWEDDEWCGYNSREKLNSEIESRSAAEVATLEYTKGKLATVNYNYVHESGDWADNETYRLDGKGHSVAMVRTIHLPDANVNVDESWLINDSEATKQSTTSPASIQPFVPDLPVATDLVGFPFWPLIRDHQQEIRSKGEFCTAKGEPPREITSRIYILREPNGPWCAFSEAKREEWSSEVRSLKTMETAILSFVDAALAMVEITSKDASARWTVIDSYGLGSGEKLRTVSRFSPDGRESWLVENGRLTRNEGVFNPDAPKVGTITPYPKIQTKLSDFSFWPLKRDERAAILSSGRLCK